MPRDEFGAAIKDALAKRVALKCSNPTCTAITSGPHSASERFVNVGVAGHITAAAPGGPRYDPLLTPEERRSIENAIWLCQTCAKLIDSDTDRYTVSVLKHWKVTAEAKALRALSGRSDVDFFPQPVSAVHTPIPRIAGLTYDDARENLVHAGWQPRHSHWSRVSDPDIQYGNGRKFWEKGYHEITNASGTGLAHCTFEFQDVYGNRLVVVTAGEVIEELNATAYVWNWYFSKQEVEPIPSGAETTRKETLPTLPAGGATVGEYPAAPPTPMSPAALIAYANGHPRPNDLIHEIGKRRRIPVEPLDSESAYLNEQVAALEIKTIRELDDLVRRYASVATRLSDYLSPQGSIDAGFILSRVLDVTAIERGGKAELIRFHESLRYSTGGARFAADMYKYYEEIKTFGGQGARDRPSWT